jgi:hypothetical protein
VIGSGKMMLLCRLQQILKGEGKITVSKSLASGQWFEQQQVACCWGNRRGKSYSTWR